MKKVFLILVLFAGIGITAHSQISRLECSAYKFIERTNGHWEKWDDDDWTPCKDEAIQISKASSGKYRIEYIKGKKTVFDYYVTYDSEKTASIREKNNNSKYYCYIDNDGDYVWTYGVSLTDLANNVSEWKKKDTRFYFWIYSEDFAMLFKY